VQFTTGLRPNVDKSLVLALDLDQSLVTDFSLSL